MFSDPIDNKALDRIVSKARLSWRKPSSVTAPWIPTNSPMLMRHLSKIICAGANLLIFADEMTRDYVWVPSLGRKIPYGGNRWMVAKLAARHQVDVVPVSIQRSRNTDFTLLIGKKISD